MGDRVAGRIILDRAAAAALPDLRPAGRLAGETVVVGRPTAIVPVRTRFSFQKD
jgi:hypothetical protein